MGASSSVARFVTTMMGIVIGLTFLFGFGNVLTLALRIGVPLSRVTSFLITQGGTVADCDHLPPVSSLVEVGAGDERVGVRRDRRRGVRAGLLAQLLAGRSGRMTFSPACGSLIPPVITTACRPLAHLPQRSTNQPPHGLGAVHEGWPEYSCSFCGMGGAVASICAS
jgi:hypothetical protein